MDDTSPDRTAVQLCTTFAAEDANELREVARSEERPVAQVIRRATLAYIADRREQGATAA